MQVLILAQHYAPEEVSGAALATHLAEDLAQRGHEVSCVTCTPSYPVGRVFPGYKNVLYSAEKCNGVHVIRVWSYITPSKRFWPRILNIGTFSLLALFGALLAGRMSIIFSYSPPLPLGLTAWLLSRLWRVPWVLRVEDLYPDAAVAAGVLKNHPTIHFLEGLERFLYHKATHISLISEGFRRNLLEKAVEAEKLSVTPVWADPHDVRPMPCENEFRQQYHLSNKFVVMYAGNLGLTASLHDVLAAAALLKLEKSIHFVIVGEGVKRNELVRQAERDGLTNVTFLPYQPRARLSEMMAAADISLVTLNAASAHFSMPNKVFNIMASGRPILAISPDDSEVAGIIRTYDCGWNVPPGNVVRLAHDLQMLENVPDRLAQMGANGRAALEAAFSRQVCIDAFERIFSSLNGSS